jgi:2-hydroxychromene-2-carboxylate isomerase
MLEVFADIWCPFAYVGLVTARAVRDDRSIDEPMLIRAWTLELVNGAPLDPVRTAHHVELLQSQVAPSLFRGFGAKSMPESTLSALALVAHANRTSAGLGERVSFELRELLFERGVDISAPAVLGDLAIRHGIDVDFERDETLVAEEYQIGLDRGVRGSPHFFCGDDDAFCPTIDIARTDEDLTMTFNLPRLTGFLERCWESRAS